jgi:hypothetical protein
MMMNAIAPIERAHTTMVSTSTLRMLQMPIQRLVSGPAMAWPRLVAASTSPAAP